MTSTTLLKVLASISAVLLLCNCSKDVQFTKVAESVSQSSTGNPVPTTPVPGNPAPGNPGPVVPQKSACQLYMEQLQPVDMNATDDYVIDGNDPALDLGAVRNVVIDRYKESLKIQSAVRIDSINDMSGVGYIQAATVGSIVGQTGALCLRAQQIDLIDELIGNLTLQTQRVLLVRNVPAATNLTVDGRIEELVDVKGVMTLTAKSIGSIKDLMGASNIRAESIDLIDTNRAVVRIYGAKVGTVIKNTGVIYLHEGATVDNPNGTVIRVQPKQ